MDIFTCICCKNCNDVCLKRLKKAGHGPFKKRNGVAEPGPELQPLVSREVCDDADLCTQVDGGQVVSAVVADEALESSNLFDVGVLQSVEAIRAVANVISKF